MALKNVVLGNTSATQVAGAAKGLLPQMARAADLTLGLGKDNTLRPTTP